MPLYLLKNFKGSVKIKVRVPESLKVQRHMSYRRHIEPFNLKAIKTDETDTAGGDFQFLSFSSRGPKWSFINMFKSFK
jgi:hypothetical protein